MSNGLNFNNILNLGVTALGTMFGGPIGTMAAQLFTQIASGAIDQVIQQVGQQFGLPQSMIDAAQGAFHGAIGDYEGAAGNYQDAMEAVREQASPADYGDLDRAVQDLMESTRQWFTEQMNDIAEGGKSEKSKGKGSGGDFFIAMAESLGKALQSQADRVQDKANELSNAVDAAEGTEDNDRADAQNEIMELQTELTAESMRLNYMSQGIHTALTKVGDALATSGRAQ